jgi:23S rRNA pseudouridine955/2504/2580 synthase
MSRISLSDIILFEDANYVVVNKPPMLATLEDRSSPFNVLKMVREKYPDATVGHRLDKETSGVLVVAKDAEAYRSISIQFENRKVNKVYHAVISGRQEFQEKLIDAGIEKLSDGTVKISRSGKPSQTIFQTVKMFQNYTLLEARPLTGRMHQIRIHLALLKCAICGDEVYGGQPIFLSSIKKRGFKTSKNVEEEPLMKRFALHALKIQFAALSGDSIEIEAPYPKDFKALLNQLERNS